MAKVTYKNLTYTCTTALKGADYVRLLDSTGTCIASFDGIKDFTEFTISSGSWTTPTADNKCPVAVIRPDGSVAEGDHTCDEIGEALNKARELGTSYNIKLFTDASQFGSDNAASVQDIYAALPVNSIAFLRPKYLTDESWKLPNNYGHVELRKGEISAIGKIFFWGRDAEKGSYSMDLNSSAAPTGVWVKYTTGDELDAVADHLDIVKNTAIAANTAAAAAQSAIDTHASTHQLKMYTDPAQVGSTYDAAPSAICAALPTNSISIFRSSGLTHADWKFPHNYGPVLIIRGPATSISKIVLIGRTTGNGDYIAEANSSTGYPTGVWKKLSTETDIDRIDSLIDNLTKVVGGKQDTITSDSAISNVLTQLFTANRALISQASGKIGISKTTSTELATLSGIDTSKTIKEQFADKVNTADVTMKIYNSPVDFGSSYTATLQDLVAAVPSASALYCPLDNFSDASWDSLNISYGVLEVVRRGSSQVSVRVWGRTGTMYIAEASTAGVPTGTWFQVMTNVHMDKKMAIAGGTFTGNVKAYETARTTRGVFNNETRLKTTTGTLQSVKYFIDTVDET